MVDIVIRAPFRTPADGNRFSDALENFAKQQLRAHEPRIGFMLLKTEFADGVVTKLLTFEDLDQALAFLRYWRNEQTRRLQ
ncbi:MAG: hypothetical protein ABWZ40_03660 [Caulobacterales bacterium]